MADNEKRLDLAQRVAERLRKSGGAIESPGLIVNPPLQSQPQPQSSVSAAGVEKPLAVEPVPAVRPVARAGQAPAKPKRYVVPPADPNDPQFVNIDQRKLYSEGYVVPNGVNNQIAEEFRVIKRPLLIKAFPREGAREGNAHVMMVTSARPGEGKTFTAINLSLSIATEPDLNVLLIDTDSHNRDLETRLGLKVEKGLLDVLADESMSISDVILRTNIPNFSIIPCGQRHSTETEMLASQRMVDVVEDLARRYTDRVIVFDTVPALASSVASVLALHVGQVVVVVEAEVTQRQAVEETIALVSGCKNVSLLLNKCQYKETDSFGYYGYYSKEEQITRP